MRKEKIQVDCAKFSSYWIYWGVQQNSDRVHSSLLRSLKAKNQFPFFVELKVYQIHLSFGYLKVKCSVSIWNWCSRASQRMKRVLTVSCIAESSYEISTREITLKVLVLKQAQIVSRKYWHIIKSSRVRWSSIGLWIWQISISREILEFQQ